MGGGVAKTLAPIKTIENLLKLCTARDDHASIDGAQFEQKPEVVQIAVVEWILVVPFHFQSHPVLVAIDLVRGCNVFVGIHHNLRVEFLFDPSKLREMRVEFARDKAFGSAWLENVALGKPKTAEDRENVFPFLRMRCRQNRKTIAPFVHLVVLGYGGRNDRLIRHPGIVAALGACP